MDKEFGVDFGELRNILMNNIQDAGIKIKDEQICIIDRGKPHIPAQPAELSKKYNNFIPILLAPLILFFS
jgi:hypothetical protein